MKEMIAEELINQMMPPLKPTDSASKAIAWMEELRSNQLPVVDNGKFLGFISEEIILETNNSEEQVSNFKLTGEKSVVSKGTHFYDVIKIASENNIQLVSVLDDDGSYFGVITVQDTIAFFAQTAAVQAPGGILVISLNMKDYSLSEISRLIESDDAKILSSSIKDDEFDSGMLRLTLKINQTDLSRIVATLERFGYKIIARYQETNFTDNQKERLDILLKYLDI
jgi:CBS domain-containing protein